jgi:hypothetical protein
MIRRLVFALAVLAVLAVPWASAQAGVRIGIGIGVPLFYRPCYGYPVVVAPAPVYYVPAPGAVYVQQPAPVYQAPATQAAPPSAYQSAAPPLAAPATSTNLPPQPIPVAR